MSGGYTTALLVPGRSPSLQHGALAKLHRIWWDANVENAVVPNLSAGAVWDQHSIQVLEGTTSLASSIPALRAGISKILAASVVTAHQGQQAVALGALFSAHTLPCVVYIPPNCADHTTDQCRPLTLQWPVGDPNAVPDVSLVSTWLLSVARANIRLVNDIHTEVGFVETLPDGSLGAKQMVRPKTSSWVQTPLGSEWTASVNGTVAAHRKVMGDNALPVRQPRGCNFFEDMNCNISAVSTKEIEENRESYTVFRHNLVRKQPPEIHNHTAMGFVIARTPPLLLEALQRYFQTHKKDYNLEDEADKVINLLVDLPETGPMRRSVFSIMQPLMEKWSGTRLKFEAVYGIRVYRRRATLEYHVDKKDTHIISAIINVDQNVEKSWPLEISDHFGKRHKVSIVPGEMIMYEGASCAHGREEPLSGDWFANVFVHMSPVV